MKDGETEQPYLRRANIKSSIWLKACLVFCLLCLTTFFCLHPLQTLLKLFGAMAWASLGMSALRLTAILHTTPLNSETYNEAECPAYSVLVPIYGEANMAATLMKRLERLDYPRDKLEILIICEEVDPDTVRAVQYYLRPPFRLIITPKGEPQTKPRALNYALQFAKGSFVTIYDAEDRPHPRQLILALAAFQKNPTWGALQAPLDYYNSHTNWLTRQFTLEYAALFHVWIPFLAKLGAPFPLGGTSNHMRRSALEACGGWDAHNVTEDADLSFRLAIFGYKIGYISCPTDEEAVENLKIWHKQRSRWMKGYMQTWLVHMHRPFHPLNGRGLARFLTLQLTLAFTLLSASVFTPIICLGFIYLGLHYSFGFTLPFSLPHFVALGISLIVGVLIGITGAIRARKPSLIVSAFFMPIYWLLQFRPTLQALKELWVRPFYWHKTPHGVSAPKNAKEDTYVGDAAE